MENEYEQILFKTMFSASKFLNYDLADKLYKQHKKLFDVSFIDYKIKESLETKKRFEDERNENDTTKDEMDLN